ncbi:MAG TPA: tRNA (guanosine(37)-N1)-methyltransferase TrmD [Anaerolineales bacterium]|nr:tRNA (guanosine(37)-N1)-methyltransferase TrmD [Anaerolineales bacterium]
MRFDIFSLFPEVFTSYLQTSILQRALEREFVRIQVHNIRDWTTDKHHITDDEPYGGGGGMVMKPDPIFAAVEGVLGLNPGDLPNVPVILLTPQGRVFTQAMAQELSAHEHMVLLCGRYEGVDERVRTGLVTHEVSIGDYVLTGGELPALILVDAITRLIPGVLGDPDGAADDSHATGLLEYPHYTRPPEFRGMKVPAILRSGDHGKIARWRREQSLLRTLQRRPDMLEKAPLTREDHKFLSKHKQQNSDEMI